ncbi:BRISC and BRCA1-A complex member 1-like [Ceratina calcarata]|uniref:BRISC and BRCA1-A complex member 1-like n=1 Tax=Ceratina calcarata TaxID=156304 RepID=A0AAJ7IV96_9HYME|nr:BRISC and BRCA1-A complex member 1-like [Ceratina calcarata]
MSNAGNVCSPVPDYKPSYSDEDNVVSTDNLPGINFPEKILFIVDTVRERTCTPFKLTTGASYTPLVMIKRVIQHFVCIKSIIQRSHEYALMILNSNSAQWICDFTSNINSIIDHLNLINEDFPERKEEDQEQEEVEEERLYDLEQMFDKVQERLTLPAKKRMPLASTFVVRLILIYSRSNCIPKFLTNDKTILHALAKNPHFFLDVLYVHEPPTQENLCEEIYSQLAMLDTNNFSYILEVGRYAAKLHDNMAKLLAHPLQRPSQSDVCYTMCPSPSSQESYNNV